MKKLFSPLAVLIIALLAFLTYSFKTYNPADSTFKTALVTYLTKLTDVFYFPQSLKNHSLPVYKIIINPDNYVALNRNLPDATKTRVLTSEYKQYVPAKFIYQDIEYDVEVRYRGVHFDHWIRPKKSWRVKFKDSNPFQGKTALNLIIPSDRGVYLEELSNFRAKKLGLLTPPSQFVVLKVNNKTQGVYWEVEHFTPAFLERLQLPVGNLYGEDDEAAINDNYPSIYSSTKYWRKYTSDETYDQDNYAEIFKLLDLINHADDQEFFQKLPLILDIDTFLAWQAHSVLMGSTHQDHQHNVRLYWHSDFGKFYILPWDVLGNYGWPVSKHPLINRVLKNPDWLKKRNQILSDYVLDDSNLKEDLDYFDQLVSLTKTAFYQDYLKFYSNFGYIQQTEKYRQQLIDQVQLIKQSLDQQSIPNEISGFTLPVSPIDLANPNKLVIDSEFQDFDKYFSSPNRLTFGFGTHYINQTIIVPPGGKLTILSGARLVFASNISLVSYSPVQAQNAVLTAQDPSKPWGVFAVVGQPASLSSFNNLVVEHASQAVVNGIYFTGALAIHGAQNTTINNSTFRFNHGDDGLNIKYTDANVAYSQFIDNDFDGLDLDFGNGKVINNTFINNGNDALDLGSASPLIENNLVDTAGDKCISLGETSSPKIIGNILKNCNMGIAVKDSSQPEIINNQIIKNHIGLASYQKKPIFPRQSFIFNHNLLSENEIDFEEEDYSLRQTGL